MLQLNVVFQCEKSHPKADPGIKGTCPSPFWIPNYTVLASSHNVKTLFSADATAVEHVTSPQITPKAVLEHEKFSPDHLHIIQK